MADTDKLLSLKQDQESLQIELREAGAAGDQARIDAVMQRLIAVGQQILDEETGEKGHGVTHHRPEKDPLA